MRAICIEQTIADFECRVGIFTVAVYFHVVGGDDRIRESVSSHTRSYRAASKSETGVEEEAVQFLKRQKQYQLGNIDGTSKIFKLEFYQAPRIF